MMDKLPDRQSNAASNNVSFTPLTSNPEKGIPPHYAPIHVVGKCSFEYSCRIEPPVRFSFRTIPINESHEQSRKIYPFLP